MHKILVCGICSFVSKNTNTPWLSEYCHSNHYSHINTDGAERVRKMWEADLTLSRTGIVCTHSKEDRPHGSQMQQWKHYLSGCAHKKESNWQHGAWCPAGVSEGRVSLSRREAGINKNTTNASAWYQPHLLPHWIVTKNRSLRATLQDYQHD